MLVVLYCSLVADVDEVDGITEQLWMFPDTTSRIPNAAPIAAMTKFCITVTVLCVVFLSASVK